MSIGRPVLAIPLGLLLVLGSQAAAEGRSGKHRSPDPNLRLRGGELRKAISGKSFDVGFAVYAFGAKGHVLVTGGNVPNLIQWRMDDDLVCFNNNVNPEHCWALYKLPGDAKLEVVDTDSGEPFIISIRKPSPRLKPKA